MVGWLDVKLSGGLGCTSYPCTTWSINPENAYSPCSTMADPDWFQLNPLHVINSSSYSCKEAVIVV